jgi:hypothetical protein
MTGNIYYDPSKGNAPTLFISGYLQAGYVSSTADLAQVSIPPLLDINVVGLNGLNTATLLQPFADPTGGNSPLTGSGGGNGFCSYVTYLSKLLGFCAVAYDASGSLATTAFVNSSLNLSSPSAAGPYSMGALSQDMYGGYAAPVPNEWQGSLGAKVVAGNGPWSIISVNSCGPGLHTVDADTLITKPPTSTNLKSTSLAYYPESNQQLGAWNNNDPGQVVNGVPVPNITVDDPFGRTVPVGRGGPSWTITYGGGMTSARGVLLAEGTRTALFFGRKGLGPFCYGEGTTDPSLNNKPVPGTNGEVVYCYDPDSNSKGGHGYPYSAFVWAYDMNDYVAAKRGSKSPWLVFPYAGWTMKFDGFGGVAWDPKTRLVYVSEPGADPGGGYFSGPLIHVFHVGY